MAVFLALVAFAPRADAQPVEVDDDQASIDLLDDAIFAISLADEDMLIDALVIAQSGDVWLPKLGVDAIAYSDADWLVLSTEMLSQDRDGLMDLAFDYVGFEQELVVDARAGDASALDELESVEVEGESLLQMFDRRGHSVSDDVRTVLGPLAAVGGVENASLASYEAALDDLDTTQEAGIAPWMLIAAGALVLVVIGFVVARGRRSEAIANTDALTGLANRRRLERDADRRRGGSGATAVLMIDVDHFKIFNDTHGHALGDEVLRQVGAALNTTFRGDDVPYRYGGEEFCVLLPNTSPGDAMAAGERARAAIAAITLPDGIRVTASVGVAVGAGPVAPQGLEAADQALYQAKNNGRNRVELSGAPSASTTVPMTTEPVDSYTF